MDPRVTTARLETALIAPDLSIAEALQRLQQAGTGMLVVAEEGGMFRGVITDGDVRRRILSGDPLTRPCGEIATRSPVIASPELTPAEVLHLMDVGREFLVNQIPVVDDDGIAVGLWLRSDFTASPRPELAAVIMAGGFGTRLRPMTDSLPKPMLPMNGRPLLERTIERLRAAGIHDVRVTTHYLAERISGHFGDGSAFGVEITYLPEEHPLGTAGSLAGLRGGSQPLLVINGDILTKVDFQAMLAFHREHRADITVGVRSYEMQVPYGVVECEGAQVRGFREKPVERFFVNAGIYLIEPTALGYIPEGERFDMSDLIDRLLQRGRPVVSFPIIEYWVDVGRQVDYEQAQLDVSNGALDP